jgi:hypothetical protein
MRDAIAVCVWLYGYRECVAAVLIKVGLFVGFGGIWQAVCCCEELGGASPDILGGEFRAGTRKGCASTTY